MGARHAADVILKESMRAIWISLDKVRCIFSFFSFLLSSPFLLFPLSSTFFFHVKL